MREQYSSGMTVLKIHSKPELSIVLSTDTARSTITSNKSRDCWCVTDVVLGVRGGGGGGGGGGDDGTLSIVTSFVGGGVVPVLVACVVVVAVVVDEERGRSGVVRGEGSGTVINAVRAR